MNKEEKFKFKKRLGIHSDASIGLKPVTESREQNRTLLSSSGVFDKIQSPKTGMVILKPVPKEKTKFDSKTGKVASNQRSLLKEKSSITQMLNSSIPNRRKELLKRKMAFKKDEVVKALGACSWSGLIKGLDKKYNKKVMKEKFYSYLHGPAIESMKNKNNSTEDTIKELKYRDTIRNIGKTDPHSFVRRNVRQQSKNNPPMYIPRDKKDK